VLKDWRQAYMGFQNAGVTTADDTGRAVLKVRDPQPYNDPGMSRLESHVHYRVCGDNGMVGRVETKLVRASDPPALPRPAVKVSLLAIEGFDPNMPDNSVNAPVYTAEDAVTDEYASRVVDAKPVSLSAKKAGAGAAKAAKGHTEGFADSEKEEDTREMFTGSEEEEREITESFIDSAEFAGPQIPARSMRKDSEPLEQIATEINRSMIDDLMDGAEPQSAGASLDAAFGSL
jgi:hypothetical protein